MISLGERIVKLLEQSQGLTDREITDTLRGHSANQQPVNIACRRLAEQGILSRRKRPDGFIGNHLLAERAHGVEERESGSQSAGLFRAGAVKGLAPGDSAEQRAAEAMLISLCGKQLGVVLA